MTRRVKRFLICSGAVFLLVGVFRLYLLISSYQTEEHFTIRFLVTLLSLVIARSILKVGLLGDRITRRSAIALIRSGFILLIIWGYRFYLVLPTLRSSMELQPNLFLATFYMISGTIVMLVGLRLSRKLRHVTLPAPSVPS